MPVIDPVEFRCKVQRILSAIYGGLHHLPREIKWDITPSFQMAELLVHTGFSTFDFNQLTLLVFAAHEEGIRADISPCNPRYMRVSFWPRFREGRISERHPTIDEALNRFRKGYSVRPTGAATG